MDERVRKAMALAEECLHKGCLARCSAPWRTCWAWAGRLTTSWGCSTRYCPYSRAAPTGSTGGTKGVAVRPPLRPTCGSFVHFFVR